LHFIASNLLAAQKKKPAGFPAGTYFFSKAKALRNQLQPLVAPQVSHFSHVPFRTIVKFWHSEHMLPV
jgi:hypothetical protein